MKKSTDSQAAESFTDTDRHESQPNPEGRDALGRFTAGNAGGPGNPFARRVARLRTILLECVTDDEMRIIAEQLVVQAKLGDQGAIKLLFQYVLGKAAAVVDPDTLDQQEVDWFCREPPGRLIKDLAGTRMPSEMMARFCRQAMPIMGQVQAQMIREELLHPEDDLLDEDDEDDFDDDEEDEGAVPTGSAAAPSTNGDPGADECRPKTEAPPEGGNGRAKPHRNGRAKAGGR